MELESMAPNEEKEEYALVLDYLPYGHPDDSRPVYQKKPIVHSVGEDHFVLLELIPKEGVVPQTQERVYVGEGDRKEIDHVKRRLKYDELTHGARIELPYVLEKRVIDDEERFVDFFNEAQPLTTRLHQLELLTGIGKKLMWTLIDERKKGKFTSFKDLRDRVKGLHHPEKLIVHRIIEELRDEHIKYRIFVR
ncbi:MAG: DUF655 domain-containing protein [Methanosarcinales archaeon Met12]|nr:MAG: DUF655 domain-containing protein [Methanosarcinales archaeon Met12]